MPEGPSLLLMVEDTRRFVRKVVREVHGNSRVIDVERMRGQRVRAIRSWGKHYLMQFDGFALRVHLMMFGSYRIDDPRDRPARLHLGFVNGNLDLYACSVRYIEGDIEDTYDWRGDVLSPDWDRAWARRKLKAQPGMLVCDALLDQQIFAGVGNIIKNEVLFRIGVQPTSTVGALPPRKLSALIDQARIYSFDFLRWRRAHVLRAHWQVHNRGECPNCGAKLHRAHLGRTRRRSFWCSHCQVLYA